MSKYFLAFDAEATPEQWRLAEEEREIEYMLKFAQEHNVVRDCLVFFADEMKKYPEVSLTICSLTALKRCGLNTGGGGWRL